MSQVVGTDRWAVRYISGAPGGRALPKRWIFN